MPVTKVSLHFAPMSRMFPARNGDLLPRLSDPDHSRGYHVHDPITHDGAEHCN